MMGFLNDNVLFFGAEPAMLVHVTSSDYAFQHNRDPESLLMQNPLVVLFRLKLYSISPFMA